MSHDLERTEDGGAKFAYAITGGVPWHRLGKPMSGLGTIDEMLTAAQADYTVHATRVAAVDEDGRFITNPDGTPVIIEDSQATIRENADGSYNGLATVGNRYTVKQNREVAERALAVVGASKGDAVVDTAGVLLDGKRFFMTIDLGPLVIDPTGVNDRIARYLVVSCGHDGVWPIRYANTDIRAVCSNTVMLGLSAAQRTFTARHTKNVDSAFDDAQRVLELSTEWARSFKDTAERMLATPVNAFAMDRVLDRVFPIKKDATERQAKNREELVGLVRAIYENDRNAGGFGRNGWSLYNSIGEYLDHHRDAKPIDRALASMDDNSWVSRMKMNAQDAVLTLI